MSRKNKMSTEKWLEERKHKPLSNIVIRGIPHKSATVSTGKTFKVSRRPRHIAHRKSGDGLSNHARLLLNKKS